MLFQFQLTILNFVMFDFGSCFSLFVSKTDLIRVTPVSIPYFAAPHHYKHSQ